MTTPGVYGTLTHMTYGGRLTRWIAAVLLAIGLAVIAAPAHASGPSSPHHAVTRFLHLYETGHGAQAYLEVQPSCRTAKGRQQLVAISDKLAKIHAHFVVKNYSESVHQGTAKISYTIYAVVKGVTKKVGVAHGEKWVRLGSSWYISCKQA